MKTLVIHHPVPVTAVVHNDVPVLEDYIVPDIDGRGYRVRDLLKQRVLAEESFPDEDLPKLDVRLEPDGDDSMVVHVGRDDVKLVRIAFSVDGVRWGDVREVGNHEVPFDQGKDKTAMCLHLPA
jgi:hypothetical protein